jgi:hypothetical protein
VLPVVAVAAVVTAMGEATTVEAPMNANVNNVATDAAIMYLLFF